MAKVSRGKLGPHPSKKINKLRAFEATLDIELAELENVRAPVGRSHFDDAGVRGARRGRSRSGRRVHVGRRRRAATRRLIAVHARGMPIAALLRARRVTHRSGGGFFGEGARDGRPEDDESHRARRNRPAVPPNPHSSEEYPLRSAFTRRIAELSLIFAPWRRVGSKVGAGGRLESSPRLRRRDTSRRRIGGADRSLPLRETA
jgi:hypothetical protein